MTNEKLVVCELKFDDDYLERYFTENEYAIELACEGFVDEYGVSSPARASSTSTGGDSIDEYGAQRSRANRNSNYSGMRWTPEAEIHQQMQLDEPKVDGLHTGSGNRRGM